MLNKWTGPSLIAVLLLLITTSTGAGEQDCGDVCAEPMQYGLTASEISAYQPPDYDQLSINTDLLNDRRYMRVNGELTVYDAPNGTPIRTLDAGFNYMTTSGQQNGWIQINPGEWVPADKLAYANDTISHFTGVFLDGSFPEYPVAWMLVNAYPSPNPGEEPDESQDMLYRYTQIHIYDMVKMDSWKWYQVGPDAWVHQTNVGKVIPKERPEAVETERWISIDLYEQVLTVYDGSEPVFATLVSTGLPRWPTYEGTFNIYYRKTRDDMTWGTPGDDFYYLEDVPWTMFFDEGRALHGAYWHDGLGYRRSHGCVNMSITDAHWLYEWVAQETESRVSSDVEEDGPAVHVWSSGTYR